MKIVSSSWNSHYIGLGIKENFTSHGEDLTGRLSELEEWILLGYNEWRQQNAWPDVGKGAKEVELFERQYEESYLAMEDDLKWKLQTGRIVENA